MFDALRCPQNSVPNGTWKFNYELLARLTPCTILPFQCQHFTPSPLPASSYFLGKPSLWLKAICMCKYCKSIRDDGDEEDYHLHLVTPQIRALTLTDAHTNTHTHIEDTRTDVSNYVEQSCKQILPVMRAANKNKYLHSIWRSLPPSLPLSACQRKIVRKKRWHIC